MSYILQYNDWTFFSGQLPFLVLKNTIIEFGRRWLCLRWQRGCLSGRLLVPGMWGWVTEAWDLCDGQEDSVCLSQEPSQLLVGNAHKQFRCNIIPNLLIIYLKWGFKKYITFRVGQVISWKITSSKSISPKPYIFFCFSFSYIVPQLKKNSTIFIFLSLI